MFEENYNHIVGRRKSGSKNSNQDNSSSEEDDEKEYDDIRNIIIKTLTQPNAKLRTLKITKNR